MIVFFSYEHTLSSSNLFGSASNSDSSLLKFLKVVSIICFKFFFNIFIEFFAISLFSLEVRSSILNYLNVKNIIFKSLT